MARQVRFECPKCHDVVLYDTAELICDCGVYMVRTDVPLIGVPATTDGLPAENEAMKQHIRAFRVDLGERHRVAQANWTAVRELEALNPGRYAAKMGYWARVEFDLSRLVDFMKGNVPDDWK